MGVDKRKLKRGVLFFVIIATLSLIYIRISSKPQYNISFISMDTVVDIKIYGESSEKSSKASTQVIELFSLLDSLWNPYSSKSEITHINTVFSKYPKSYRNDTTDAIENIDTLIAIHPYTADIIFKSIEFSNETSKKFNIAAGTLIDLWRRYGKKGELPCDCTIKNIQRRGIVDVNNVVVDTSQNTISLKQRQMKLNFGAIAKGYALKQAADIMEKNEIDHYIINAGGDIYATTKRGRNFSVGVKNPFETSNFLETVKIKNESVATSGGYERFFVIDSVLYTHIIDPVSGYPITEQYSVTVILDNPIYADIWATLLAVDRSDSILNMFPQNGKYFIALSDTIITNM